jgi:hypothetical protein
MIYYKKDCLFSDVADFRTVEVWGINIMKIRRPKVYYKKDSCFVYLRKNSYSTSKNVSYTIANPYNAVTSFLRLEDGSLFVRSYTRVSKLTQEDKNYRTNHNNYQKLFTS